MQNLRILNNKEIKQVLNKIKTQFGIKEIKLNLGMLRNKEGKIFLITKDINKVNLDKLRINELGLYIAREDKGIRLSIEGSYLFGKYATKNVHETDDADAYFWMTGEDISCKKEFKDFVIIKYKDNYLGTGKWKENKILNFIPKERRIK